LKKLDEEEAALREARRAEILEHTRKVTRNESDKVKAFKSRMLLSRVQEENAELLRIKKEMEALEAAREQYYLDIQSATLKAQEEEEMRRRAEAKERLVEGAKLQAVARDRIRARNEAERSKEEAETKRILEEAKVRKEEQRQARIAAKAAARVRATETLKENDAIQRRRRAEREAEEAEHAAAIEASKATLRKQAERKAYATKKFEEKLAVRQRIIDAGARSLEAAQKEEEERLARDQVRSACSHAHCTCVAFCSPHPFNTHFIDTPHTYPCHFACRLPLRRLPFSGRSLSARHANSRRSYFVHNARSRLHARRQNVRPRS
jgi:hypothetical protein